MVRAFPMPKVPASEALPFVKWAGGKRQLIAEITRFLPVHIGNYFEPFAGGGALFFALAEAGAFERAVLADSNAELVETYLVVKRDVEALLRALARHELRHGEEHYYRVRAQRPTSGVEIAARLIYLNKAGYNGLYRVNSRGEFNVPFGRHVSPGIRQEARLRAASLALARAEIVCADYKEAVADAAPGDFVYFDPPYVALSQTAWFAHYAVGGFPDEEQAMLAELLRCLGGARVPALLSNADCALTRDLYQGLPQKVVSVPRAINADSSKRGPVAELLVQSFEYPRAVRAAGRAAATARPSLAAAATSL